MFDDELYVNDPGRIKENANTISDAGSAYYSVWQGVKAELLEAHATHPPPWGNDRAGMAFLQGYGDPTGDSEGLKDKKGNNINGPESPAARIISGSDMLAGPIRNTGPAIVNFVNGVIDDDELIETWLIKPPDAPAPPGKTEYPPHGPSLRPH